MFLIILFSHGARAFETRGISVIFSSTTRQTQCRNAVRVGLMFVRTGAVSRKTLSTVYYSNVPVFRTPMRVYELSSEYRRGDMIFTNDCM